MAVTAQIQSHVATLSEAHALRATEDGWVRDRLKPHLSIHIVSLLIVDKVRGPGDILDPQHCANTFLL